MIATRVLVCSVAATCVLYLAACVAEKWSWIPEICTNGRDDDGDGAVDCYDPDCRGFHSCCRSCCDYNCVCDYGESSWCPDCLPCSLNGAPVHEYIVAEMIQPTTAAEARTLGADLDGDGDIDNKLGQINSLFPWAETINEGIASQIRNGTIILLARLAVDRWPSDDYVGVQLLPGDTDPTRDATEDNLTSTGHARVAPDADQTLVVCGELMAGYLATCPGTLEVPFVIFGVPVTLPLERAALVSEGIVDAYGWADVMIGGAISRDTMQTDLLPALIERWNEDILEDPGGSTWGFIRNSIDCACDDSIEGCENAVNGQGECECWSEDPTDGTAPLTVTEMMCNALLATALRPDVDTDGDMVPDLLSVGMKVNAVPVTIDD